MPKHHKHPPILKSTIGSFHRNEWAIYGSNCASIALLFNAVQNELKNEMRMAYIDADHSSESHSSLIQTTEKQFHLSDALEWNSYDDRLVNWPVDCVFVNGNHYSASKQIVIIDSNKKDSLKRRLSQLTHIDLILLTKESEERYDFLNDIIKSSTPILNIKSIKAISDWIRQNTNHSEPELKALILAGGESKRMQEDKSNISYYGKENQVQHLADITSALGLDTFISKASDFNEHMSDGYPVIKDKLLKMGPFGAIISAFIHNPNVAYLVLACDLPFVTKESLETLIENRSSAKFATSYKLENQKFPEPLLTIYEPKIYQRMLRFLSLGYACPRKVLINSDIKAITPKDQKIAFNANTPEEKKEALRILKDK